MKSTKPSTPFAPHEIRRFIMPLTLACILALAGMIFDLAQRPPSASTYFLGLYGIAGIIYLVLCNIVYVRTIILKESYGILNSIMFGAGLGYLVLLLPKTLSEISHILIIFGVITIATISGRKCAYITLAMILAISLPERFYTLNHVESILEFFMPIVVSIILMDVIFRIKDITQQHIHRLETINKVSREIMRSLNTQKTISLLDETIKETLLADTYFIGLLKGEEIEFDLFYDAGEYFNGTRVPVQGSLSGWVIKNQKELFLPDLRDDVSLDGVQLLLLGKEKTSLSWIGVPLIAENVTGVLALASYTANAFDRADLELLSNLGQHITIALDNTIRHAQVENQARLDSLTGVFNHGYFLKRLAEQAQEATDTNSKISLIMLDVDYFKQYNDTYGHLVGDYILESLCSAIKQHIKQHDAVGRWGGEEFIISLPNATGSQARLIAKRISETMKGLRVLDRDQNNVPVPTISQGIAVFPTETDEIFHLIDFADKRLYVAKKRGRNQIEPETDIWQE